MRNAKTERVSLTISQELKKLAIASFHDNSLRELMTAEQRESASRAYERIADNLVGNEAEIARLYNLERAKFLRGEIDSIAENIPEFRKERGL